MTKEPLLIVGTAPAHYVLECLKTHGGTDPHLLVPAKNAEHFQSHSHNLHSFEGMLKPGNAKLREAICDIKPSAVIVVYGESFFHERTIAAVSNACRNCGVKPDIFLSQGHYLEPVDPVILKHIADGTLCCFHWSLTLFIAATTTGLIAVVWHLFGWPLAICLILMTMLCEVLLRCMRSYSPFIGKIRSQPAQAVFEKEASFSTDLFMQDSELLWKTKPSSTGQACIDIKQLGISHRALISIDSKGRRSTGSSTLELKTIAIHGCSFTFGYPLSDDQTYPWLLQTLMPTYSILNHGCPGYSMYQSLLMMERTLPLDKPAVVVFGFHPHLTERNTNSFEWMLHYHSPSCISANGKLKRYKPTGYKSLYLSQKISIIIIIEVLLNKARFNGRNNPDIKRRTAEHLLLQMRKTCSDNNAMFMVACLDDCTALHNFLIKNKFNWCIAGTSLTKENDDGKFTWTMEPIDNHPNEQAHEVWAGCIHRALNDLLLKGHCSPDVSKIMNRGSLSNERSELSIYPVF